MLGNEQKRQLEELFWGDGIPPGDLNDEERAYWFALTSQWDRALLRIYEGILRQDDSHDKA